MGVTVAFHADFDPASTTGWCPVTVTVTDVDTPVPLARTLAEKKTFVSGFEYVPSADRVLFSSTVEAGNAVAIWCAAALAAAAGGTVDEPQLNLTATGDTGLAVIAKLAEQRAFVASVVGPTVVKAKPKAKRAAAPRAAVEADLSKPVRTYAASDAYEVGERITHPSFGEGVVEVSVPGKVTAFFGGTRRVLVQSGEIKPALVRPDRIDHRTRGGSQKV
jgi:hypothetical protein|nr:hypothetical protein [Kofleriaceae bacterium]